MQALRKFDTSFPLSPVDAPTPTFAGNNSLLWWPFLVNPTAGCPTVVDANAANAPGGYACPGNGNSEGAALVQFHPYSIAYIGVSFLPAGVSYFRIKNKRGGIVQASPAAVQSALSFGVAAGSANLPSIASETSPTGNMDATLDADVEDAWPITEFDFYMIPGLSPSHPIILTSSCHEAFSLTHFDW
jgi:hypothetical protein